MSAKNLYGVMSAAVVTMRASRQSKFTPKLFQSISRQKSSVSSRTFLTIFRKSFSKIFFNVFGFSLLAAIITMLPIEKLQAASIQYESGFESGNIDQLKCSGNCPIITSSIVKSGSHVANFTLTPDMPTNYRTESILRNGFGDFDLDKEYWIGLDFRYEDWDYDSLSESAPIQVHTRPSSWDAACGLGSAYSTAPFFLHNNRDQMKFVTYGGKVLWTGPIIKKEWQNITIRFKFSTGSGGYIEAWRNGVSLGRVNGQNYRKLDNCGLPMRIPYFKMGVYKWDWKRKVTEADRRELLIDNLKIAAGSDGYNLVSPNIASPPSVEPDPVEEPMTSEPINTTPIWTLATGSKILVNGASINSDGVAQFDGVDDHINVNDLSLAGGALTLTAKFLATKLDNCAYKDCRIFSKAVGLAGDDHYLMVSTVKSDSVARLRFRLKLNGSTATLIADSGDIVENEWVNVAAVYDGQSMKLYKDGVLVGNMAKEGSITTNSSAQTWIGDNPATAGSRPWKGEIAKLSIYNYAMSASEINESTAASEPEVPEEPPTTNPTTVPGALWDMADVTGSDLVNGAQYVAGQGVQLDGIDDYLNIGSLDVPGEALTLSASFESSDFANCSSFDCRIVSKASGIKEQDHYFMISTILVGDAVYLRFRLKTNGQTSTLIAKSDSLAQNQRIHVVAVYNGNQMILYKDGVKVGSRSKTGSITTNNEIPIWIGANPPKAETRAWNGVIDDVKVFNYALSEEQIAILNQ